MTHHAAGEEIATAEVQHRNPTMTDQNGAVTFLPDLAGWSEVPLEASPEACEHGETMCASCSNEWNQDYYLRFKDAAGRVVWLSPDHPDHPVGR